MPNTITKITVEFTLKELNDVVTALKELRSQTDWNVERDSFDKYKEPGVLDPYAISQAEGYLERRYELAQMVHRLSGESISEKPETLAKLRAAVEALNAQKAAEKETQEV
jgi:hypothetical protein